ncbi:hypothetical protein C4J81_06695 [Deltaproteobacteria bacterium Smac51]|nr:hypothetical protein C4J81_06695 [Deltaproteobacteria bacterium Smac51]
MNRLSGFPIVFALLLTLLLCQGHAFAEVNLQVMSVQDAGTARQEADRLFDQGIPAFTQAEEVPGRGVWNRVYIGPFETEAEARAAANNLKEQGTISDFVLKTEMSPPAASSVQGMENGVPVIGSEAPPVVEQAPAASLPVASTPTYGENISPEQARELGVGGATVGTLPTYGSSESVPASPANSLDLKEGDTLPGLVGGSVAVTPPASGQTSGGLSTYGDSEGLPPAPAVQTEVPVTAAPVVTAPVVEAAPVQTPVPAPVQAASPRPDGPTPVGDMKIKGFTMLVDLSSSMRNMSNCQGRVKEEAVSALIRKMNHRIPGQPYTAALRVFGYKSAWSRKDFTTTYYGPTTYDRDAFEDSIARLVAADSVSPFGEALKAADNELASMGNPKAVLMFADFEETMGSGAPVQNASTVRRRYGKDIAVYTFYITRQTKAESLAKELAAAGGGKAYNICQMLSDENAFESMMMEIFGPADLPPCADSDGDGVCDEDDLCPNTPAGAPVDARGCWIAAYSQFFDFDKAVVKSAFLPRIEHAASILNNNPKLPRVTIAGHTDNIGTDSYNMDLGRRRAQAVFDLMVKYGVPADRMAVESYGKTRPIAPNDTEEGRSQNRRVEFHIGDVPPAQ